MRERIEKLSKEILDLEKLLEDKTEELEGLNNMVDEAKEARRVRSEEAILEPLFRRVFNQSAYVEVDPEEGVNAQIWIKHSASPKINAILGPITDHTVSIKNGVDYTGYNQYVDITFPYEKLTSVKEGLTLSAGVDLSEDKPRFTAMC